MAEHAFLKLCSLICCYRRLHSSAFRISHQMLNLLQGFASIRTVKSSTDAGWWGLARGRCFQHAGWSWDAGWSSFSTPVEERSLWTLSEGVSSCWNRKETNNKLLVQGRYCLNCPTQEEQSKMKSIQEGSPHTVHGPQQIHNDVGYLAAYTTVGKYSVLPQSKL